MTKIDPYKTLSYVDEEGDLAFDGRIHVHKDKRMEKEGRPECYCSSVEGWRGD